MVRLTRINQAPFYLNSDLIEFIDSTPDTLITTVNGTKILVVEDPQEVLRRVVEFRRSIYPVTRGPVGAPDPVQGMSRV